MRRLSRTMVWMIALMVVAFGSGAGYAQTANADTVVEHDSANGPGIPKGIVGQDGIKCHGEASYKGYTYKLTRYIGADADEMAGNATKERTWQVNQCAYVLESQIGWFFTQEYHGYYCNGDHMIQGVVPDRNNYCYDMPGFPEFKGMVKDNDHPDGNITMTITPV